MRKFSSSGDQRTLLSSSRRATARTPDSLSRPRRSGWVFFTCCHQNTSASGWITPCKRPQVLTALLPHSRPGGFLGLHDAPLFDQKEVLHGDTKVFPRRTRSCGAPPPCRDLQGSFSGVQLDVFGASVCSGCSQSPPPTNDLLMAHNCHVSLHPPVTGSRGYMSASLYSLLLASC